MAVWAALELKLAFDAAWAALELKLAFDAAWAAYPRPTGGSGK
jgi:hypothetical protein